MPAAGKSAAPNASVNFRPRTGATTACAARWRVGPYRAACAAAAAAAAERASPPALRAAHWCTYRASARRHEPSSPNGVRALPPTGVRALPPTSPTSPNGVRALPPTSPTSPASPTSPTYMKESCCGVTSCARPRPHGRGWTGCGSVHPARAARYGRPAAAAAFAVAIRACRPAQIAAAAKAAPCEKCPAVVSQASPGGVPKAVPARAYGSRLGR